MRLNANLVLQMRNVTEVIKLSLTPDSGGLQFNPQTFTNAIERILACKISSHSESYRGGLNSLCDVGYSGKMCTVCVKDSNGTRYARSSGLKCSECQPIWV
jgi:hypothetical protein